MDVPIIGLAVVTSLIVFPLSLYFYLSGNEIAGVVLFIITVIITIVSGMTLQQLYGNGANVLIVVAVLLILLLVIIPKQQIIRVEAESESEPGSDSQKK